MAVSFERVKRLAFAVCVSALMLLCGCVPADDIDNQSYALAVGIDREENGRLIFTILIPKTTYGAQEDTVGQAYASVHAGSVFEAMDLLNASMPFKANYLHVNYVVFAEELAANGDIEKLLPEMIDLLGLRQTVKLFIARGGALQFINGLTSDEQSNFAKRQKTIGLYKDITGFFPRGELIEFTRAMLCGTMDAALPLGAFNVQAAENTKERKSEDQGLDTGENSSSSEQPEEQPQQPPHASSRGVQSFDSNTAGDLTREGGSKSEIFGTAIFNKGTLAATLSGRESKLLLMGRGDFDSGLFEVQLGGEQRDAVLHLEQKPRVTVTQGTDGKLRADAALRLTLRMYKKEGYGQLNTFQSKEGGSVEKEYADSLEEELKALFSKCQAAGSDAFGFGRYAAMQLEDWNSDTWKARYADMEVDWKVTLQSEWGEEL